MVSHVDALRFSGEKESWESPLKVFNICHLRAFLGVIYEWNNDF